MGKGTARQEAERATIDVTALIAEALRAKQEAEAKRYAEAEQTPEGERLTWRVTAEQVARINAGEREALDAFYFEPNNFRRIQCSAYAFFRHSPYFRPIIAAEDLTQQVYCDLATGLLKLRPYDRAISNAIFHSFRYAAVGGIDEIYIPHARRGGRCRKQANCD